MSDRDDLDASVQRAARALGDPTRHRIFRLIADAPSPLVVDELAGAVGVHPNAVRQHLAKLVDADLVVVTTLPVSGPGRPPLGYAIAPDAAGRWATDGPYQHLAMLLSEVIRTGDPAREVGRRAGRRLGESSTDDDGVAAIVAEMARQGFAPSATTRGDVVEVALHACPFAAVAAVDPTTVCDLHAGLADGLAEVVGSVAVDHLAPQDPRRGPCVLLLRRGRPEA